MTAFPPAPPYGPRRGPARPGTAAGPVLVLAAHGTRSRAGEQTLERLAGAVRAQRPGYRVELAYLEISRPLLADLLPTLHGPVTVVPLLLAGGYHVHIDLPAVVARTRPGAVVTRHLGPHYLLAESLARRLAGAGLRPHQPVVLGAAGSADPAALAEVRATARLLAARLARPVTAAFAASGTPAVGDVVTPETAVASYLLAPGFFHDRLLAAGAGLVTEPLGEEAASLVWIRHDAAHRAGHRARKCQPAHHHASTTSTRPAG
ncbi:sirohydrochlorin chelatase [Thermoactinospora rubra]|uniref:sirohydrochlorin chelatase n=1 Tax=Thermoactinospora rubra TaxID=1088767 RepID=UPI001F0A3AE7|nr:CbiX/SirB N-terminal domain-containing protein [Thermoactinospora rubra]